MTAYTDLSAFQRDILFVIADNHQPNGLDILSKLETYYTEETIHHGRLYPNLDELVENDLVVKAEQTGRANKYALTDTGKQLIDERTEWQTERTPTTS